MSTDQVGDSFSSPPTTRVLVSSSCWFTGDLLNVRMTRVDESNPLRANQVDFCRNSPHPFYVTERPRSTGADSSSYKLKFCYQQTRKGESQDYHSKMMDGSRCDRRD